VTLPVWMSKDTRELYQTESVRPRIMW